MPPNRSVTAVHWRRPVTSVYSDNYHYGFDYYGDMLGHLDKKRDGRPVTPEKPKLPTLDEHAAIHIAKRRLHKRKHGFEPDDSSKDKVEAIRAERERIEDDILETRRSRSLGRSGSVRRVRSFGAFTTKEADDIENELKAMADNGRRNRSAVRSMMEFNSQEGQERRARIHQESRSSESRSVGFSLQRSGTSSEVVPMRSPSPYQSTLDLANDKLDLIRQERLEIERELEGGKLKRSSSSSRLAREISSDLDGLLTSTVFRSGSPMSNYTYVPDDQPSHWELKCKQMSIEIEQLTARIIEAETKLKSEVTRIKKKYQVQITEMEMSLDVANKSNIELQKTIKKQSLQITEIQNHYDEVQRQLQSTIDQYGIAQRRAQALQAELEEIRVNLENTLRMKRSVEQQYEEAHVRINELTTINVNITAIKSKLEADLSVIHADYEEITKELRLADERATKAQVELKHTVDILHEEQERVVKIESIRKSLEIEVKTLHTRIEEVETNALVGGKRVISKLEARIRDIELELDEEKRRHAETVKMLRKRERSCKEMMIQSEEDHKNVTLLNDMVEKLNEKIKVYKRQLTEQEGMSQSNLTRVRRFQRELETAEERADTAESNLNFIRAKHRSWVTTSQVPAGASKQVYVVEEHRHESY